MSYAPNTGINSVEPAGGFPHISEFILPSADLADFWRARAGLGLENGAPVAAWTGTRNGTVAAQATENKRPLFVTNAISEGRPAVVGDGVDDVLTTTIPAPAQGVLCVGFRAPNAYGGSHRAIVGAGGAAGLALGITSGGLPAGQVGSTGYSALAGGAALTPGGLYVLTLAWNATNAFLRVNGVQVDTDTIAGYTPGSAITICARGTTLPSPSKIGAFAPYLAYKSGADLAAIEAGVALEIGLALS